MEDELSFTLALEEGPHLSIPRTINGDFSTITAPAGEYDPFYFRLEPCSDTVILRRRSPFLFTSRAVRQTLVALATDRPYSRDRRRPS